MKHYVAGFLFDEEFEKVALIKKNRPEWQAGFFNGIGGKIELDENPRAAMIREFKEEAGMDIEMWESFAVLRADDWIVYMYWANGDLSKLQSLTDEPVSVWEIHELTELNVIPNLRWLVPMAIDMAKNKTFLGPWIHYNK